ncbi:hypothetical protein [Ekhidna sp.]|uniref:hypothetical protein n=1 Tax=Ekhidna sp. TaxID=2608089 RepID=UPI003CCC415C
MEKQKVTKSLEEKTPSWLKTIQLNSWEAELLVSALVLYALFQVPEFLEKTSLQTFDRASRMHGLFRLLEKAIQLLSIGYILHILVRGIWVASVGLSYVFPKGVNHESLNFKGNFKKELTKNGSLVKMVLRLEELSSIIYGVSFIFFGTLVGFGSLLFTFLFFVEFIVPLMNQNPYFAVPAFFFILFYFLLCIIVFIDFLTNGYFRRKNWSADWFYYVAFFFRIVTLSFLYRRSLLVLISNIKGWRSYLVPFVVLGVTGGFLYLKDEIGDNRRDNYYQSNANGDYLSANYENLRDDNDYLVATVQSDIINGSALKVFLRDLGSFGGIYVFEGKTLDVPKWESLSSDSISNFLNKRLSVSIDDHQIDSIKWFKNQHPSTYAFGFTSFIDLASFERGTHFLKIGIDTTNMKDAAKKIVENENYSLTTISNIYFFYDKP